MHYREKIIKNCLRRTGRLVLFFWPYKGRRYPLSVMLSISDEMDDERVETSVNEMLSKGHQIIILATFAFRLYCSRKRIFEVVQGIAQQSG